MRLTPLLLAALPPLVASSPAWGQSPAFEVSAPNPAIATRYASDITFVGDVDGDGLADVAVGELDFGGENRGRVFVYSGATSALLWSREGQPAESLGRALAPMDDLDGDGVGELAVSLGSDFQVWVLSGANGSLVYSMGPGVFGLGDGMLTVPDVDSDGVRDLAVTSVVAGSAGLLSTGVVQLRSGVDGALLWEVFGPTEYARLGMSLASCGDQNADGVADLLVGAPLESFGLELNGTVRVLSGADGSQLRILSGGKKDYFGTGVASPGDIDGDGIHDLVVGAALDNANGMENAGRVTAFSGASGSVLWQATGQQPEQRFGRQLASGSDLDGDGLADLAVGVSLELSSQYYDGSVVLLSSSDRRRLFELLPFAQGEFWGFEIDMGGDLNGDGIGDFLVSTGAGNESVRGYLGSAPIGTKLCGPAVSSSSGAPARIIAIGREQVSLGLLDLVALDLPPGAPGYFLGSLSTTGGSIPPGSQGRLCLGGPVARFTGGLGTAGFAGDYALRVDLASIPTSPSQPVLAGQSWAFQFWFRDNNPGPTSNFTDAIAVTYQ